MTDLELLLSYNRSSSKTVAIVRAMYSEGMSLKEIVDRLRHLGKNPAQSLYCTFGTSRPELITDKALMEFAVKRKIKTGEAGRAVQKKQQGVVSAYCNGCFYLKHEFGMKSCDYIGVEFKRRSCPAGDGCTKRKLIRRKKDETQ